MLKQRKAGQGVSLWDAVLLELQVIDVFTVSISWLNICQIGNLLKMKCVLKINL